MRTYSIHEVAEYAHVHSNTIRLYERLHFISVAKRLENGYRVFTDMHLHQLDFSRLALRSEVLQNGLRKKAIEVIHLCSDLDFIKAMQSCHEYQAMIVNEIARARSAIATVEKALLNEASREVIQMKRHEVARHLNTTMDTLRNWELNGLVKVKRHSNGYRVYDATDLDRLNIIRTLRSANYSLMSILRLLNHLEEDGCASVEEILNTPSRHEDIVSVCDRLLTSLEATKNDAMQMQQLLFLMQQTFQTLH